MLLEGSFLDEGSEWLSQVPKVVQLAHNTASTASASVLWPQEQKPNGGDWETVMSTHNVSGATLGCYVYTTDVLINPSVKYHIHTHVTSTQIKKLNLASTLDTSFLSPSCPESGPLPPRLTTMLTCTIYIHFYHFISIESYILWVLAYSPSSESFVSVTHVFVCGCRLLIILAVILLCDYNLINVSVLSLVGILGSFQFLFITNCAATNRNMIE